MVYIKDIHPGDTVISQYGIVSVRLSSYSKGFKLDVRLGDKTGTIGGILWDCDPHMRKAFKPGDVVNVNAMAVVYQDKIQLNLNSIESVEGDYDLNRLIPTSRFNRDEMWEKLLEKVNSIQNPYIKRLLENILGDDSISEKFKIIPAGKKWHHNFIGGLLQHTLYMMGIADSLSRLYPLCDKDLLLCGVVLHDIGKIYELRLKGNIDYTSRGRMEGHISIGYYEVSKAIDKIDDFPEELAMEIKHLILSHQGEKEMGSPVVPMTLEAVMLNLIDETDSQINAYLRIIGEEAAEGVEWSNFIRLRERFFYFGGKYADNSK